MPVENEETEQEWVVKWSGWSNSQKFPSLPVEKNDRAVDHFKYDVISDSHLISLYSIVFYTICKTKLKI